MNLIRRIVDIKEEKPKFKVTGLLKKSIITSILLISVVTGSTLLIASHNTTQADSFGLGNNYTDIIALNDKISNSVPLSLDPITTSQAQGDKRIIAALIFLQNHDTPIATFSVAKAFVESADRYGFGDKWPLLIAMAGIESGFCRVIPLNNDGSSTHNCWGFGGQHHWWSFQSFEQAIDVVSRQVAKSYGIASLDKQTIASSIAGKYCASCKVNSDGKDVQNWTWVVTVNGYINQLYQLQTSI